VGRKERERGHPKSKLHADVNRDTWEEKFTQEELLQRKKEKRVNGGGRRRYEESEKGTEGKGISRSSSRVTSVRGNYHLDREEEDLKEGSTAHSRSNQKGVQNRKLKRTREVKEIK